MYGRRRITHLLLLSLAAAAPLAAAGTAEAAPPPLAATVTPETVYPAAKPCTTGTGEHHFTVSGTGFKADERLDVTVGGISYAPATADETGAYTAGYDLKAIPAGRAAVIVTGDQGSRAVSAVTVGWSGCRSWKNGQIRLTGAGFMSHDQITARLDGDTTADATTTSGTGGDFDLRIVCDPATPHTVTLADTHQHALEFGEFSCL
jgi:hypothetical protein